MAIRVNCSGCGREFRAKDQFRNTRLKCPNCKASVVVQGPHVCGSDVFISYSSADKQVADAVCAAMESKNLRCWIAPRNIPAGATWGSAIIEGIEDSRIMLLVLSQRANDSDQVLREVERAVAKHKPIIPFRIESLQMRKDLEYFLASCQFLDATSGALEEHLAGLTRTVKHLLLDRAIGDPEPNQAGTAGSDGMTARDARPKPERTLQQAALVAGDKPPIAGSGRGKWLVLGVGVLAILLVVAAVVYLPGQSASSNAANDKGDAGKIQPTPTTSTTQPAEPAKVDLLARVNLKEDAIKGAWSRRPEGLFSGPPPAGLRLGKPPPGDYDFHITFTPLFGDEVVGLVLSRAGQDFAFLIGGRGPAAFWRKERGPAAKSADAHGLRNGVRHTVVIRARKSSLIAIVNGVRVRDVRTDYTDLEVPPLWNIGTNVFGVATSRVLVIHSAEYVPVNETP
jgi:hypothetical protein